MKKTLQVLFLAITVVACNSPLSRKVNEATMVEDMKELVAKDSTSAMTIAITLTRYKLASVNMSDMTYQKILDDGNKYNEDLKKVELQEKALADRAKAEEQANILRLSKTVTGAVYAVKLQTGDNEFEQDIAVSTVFENKSQKEIRAVKGSFIFYDLFDVEIFRVNITNDNSIAVGQKDKGVYTVDYNQFNDDQNRFLSKQLKDMKIFWKTDKVIFSDNTTLQ